MTRIHLSVACLTLASFAWPAAGQQDLGTAFTYQGQFSRDCGGICAAQDHDLRFSLWDDESAGIQVGPSVEFTNMDFQSDGRFTVELDFGVAVFDGTALWLRIEVRPTGGQFYTILNPRQPITATPYALHALNAGQWENSGSAIMNTNTGFVGINRDYTVGLEWFGVHAPVSSGYGGMYVTTEGATAWPFYGYKAGSEAAWTYLDGGTGKWHLNVSGNRMTVTDSGNVGIGTTSPAHKLHVVSNADRGIHGESSNTTGTGLHGLATHASGQNVGVSGETSSTAGTAVNGYAAAATGETYGGRFSTQSSAGTGLEATGGTYGVAGAAFTSAGESYGGIFRNFAPTGAGVTGLANHVSGTASGVWGQCTSPNGFGVRSTVSDATTYSGYFEGGRNYFQGNVGIATLSPTNPLSVAGDSDISGRVSIGITGADARLLVRGTTGEDAFRVRVEGATKLLVKDNGGVGIGSNFGTLPANGLRTAGAVGIGADPGAFTLVSNGDAAKPGGGSWSNFSDARLKRDIRPMTAGTLERLLALRGCTFEYIEEAIENRLGRPGVQTGFIAQEVQKTFPDWVDADDEGYLYVTERGLSAIMVEAVRELRAEKDAAIASLKADNDELERRLAKLEAALAKDAEERIASGR